MRMMKCGKIYKFSVALKIWLKNESFDHSEPAKDEIWQNPEKFWSVLQIWLKTEIDHSGPAEDEIWQNPEIFSRVENLAWNQEFDHSWPAKVGRIIKFWSFIFLTETYFIDKWRM